jgi:ribose 5-phosphate isomerase B
MRVHLASDHAGYQLKEHIAGWLREHGHVPVDHGAARLDPQDDYPTFVLRAAEAVAGETGSLGIVLGGSGNGEQIAANKVRGVRAALAHSDETAALAREHNDANVLSIGARMQSLAAATGFVERFLTTPFTGEERHARRISMLARYESDGDLPALPGDVTSPA